MSDKDRYEIAFERIRSGDPRVVGASMRFLPSPYDQDMADPDAFKKLLSAIA